MKNREIKFRCWNTETETMIQMRTLFLDMTYRKSISIMQYAGLKDKNGKEIYEGDIIISVNGHQYLVVWHDEGWKYKTQTEDFGVPLYRRVAVSHEIIGNLYENPELIK